jgi:hypothetical protein
MVIEGLIRLLLIVLMVPGVPKACVGALKIPHEDLSWTHPIPDGVGREVLQPCLGRVGQEQEEVADNEIVIMRSVGLVGKLVVLKSKIGV